MVVLWTNSKLLYLIECEEANEHDELYQKHKTNHYVMAGFPQLFTLGDTAEWKQNYDC